MGNTTAAPTIAEFLTARYDEFMAGMGNVVAEYGESMTPDLQRKFDQAGADIAAKRAIIDEHYNDGKGHDGIRVIPAACARCGVPDEYGVEWPCRTLRLLASVYTDHAHYRPEWSA